MAEPKWRQVLEDLERRLSAGDIADRFPTDRELVEHYGVSRHTVREAVRHLRARGIIQRERGRGPPCASPSSRPRPGPCTRCSARSSPRASPQTSTVLALDMRPDALRGRAARARGRHRPVPPRTHPLRRRAAAGGRHGVAAAGPRRTAARRRLQPHGVVRRARGAGGGAPDRRARDDHRTRPRRRPRRRARPRRRRGLPAHRADRRARRPGRRVPRHAGAGSRFALVSDWAATTAHTPRLQVEHRA